MSDSNNRSKTFIKRWAKLKASLFEMDGLDSVEVVIAIEEIFGVAITDAEAGAMNTPKDSVDWLLPCVAHKRPNEKALRILHSQSVAVGGGQDGTGRRC